MKRLIASLFYTLLCGALVMGACNRSMAQFRPAADGRIIGQVIANDKTGIAKAVITLSSNEPTHQTRTVKSDKKGKFEASLPDGSYSLKIEKCGFVTYTSSGSTKIAAGVEWKAAVPLVVDPDANCAENAHAPQNNLVVLFIDKDAALAGQLSEVTSSRRIAIVLRADTADRLRRGQPSAADLHEYNVAVSFAFGAIVVPLRTCTDADLQHRDLSRFLRPAHGGYCKEVLLR